MKTIRLKKKEERRVLRGHPWVLSNELREIPAGVAPGEIVDVLDFSGRFVGRGAINPHTLIAVRILTRKREEIDAAFLLQRITTARDLRTRLGFGESFRAVFAKATACPGSSWINTRTSSSYKPSLRGWSACSIPLSRFSGKC